MRAACALFARPRSAAVGPGSRTEMGKGGFGGAGPPWPPLWKPALTMPARRKRLCALCFENSLRLASPRSELCSAGLEPRAIFIFPLHRARGLGKTGAGAQPSSGRRAWRLLTPKASSISPWALHVLPAGLFLGGRGGCAASWRIGPLGRAVGDLGTRTWAHVPSHQDPSGQKSNTKRRICAFRPTPLCSRPLSR